jgi:hypothetical protein
LRECRGGHQHHAEHRGGKQNSHIRRNPFD